MAAATAALRRSKELLLEHEEDGTLTEGERLYVSALKLKERTLRFLSAEIRRLPLCSACLIQCSSSLGYSQMLDNQLRSALQTFHSILDLSPADLFAVKKAQLLSFILGGREDMLKVGKGAQCSHACIDEMQKAVLKPDD
jgi:hypothetical protein